MNSARSSMVSARRSLSASGAPDRPSISRSMRGKVGGGVAVQPDLGVRREVRLRRLQRGQHVGVDDDVPGRDHVDAMGERHAHQIGVEQRDHAADAGDADPDRQELGPVGHQEADRVALGDALRERPARVAVRARAELAIAEVLAVGEQRRRVAVFLRQLLDQLREDARRILGDMRRVAERAQRARKSDQVGLEPLDEFHGVSVSAADANSRRGIIGHPADGGKG